MKHTKNQKKRTQRTQRTRRIRKTRKVRNVSKRLGGVDPPKVQLEKMLQLVKQSKESKLTDKIMDMKHNNKSLIIDATMMSKLSYWNASQIMNNTNEPDMRNIDYMINHSISSHKISNTNTWKKNINNAMFRDTFLKQAKDSNYGGPLIKTKVNKTFTLGELTIIILQHRLDVINWMEKIAIQKEANALAKKQANARAAEEPPSPPKTPSPPPKPPPLTRKNSTPEDWDDE